MGHFPVLFGSHVVLSISTALSFCETHVEQPGWVNCKLQHSAEAYKVDPPGKGTFVYKAHETVRYIHCPQPNRFASY